MPKRFVIKMIAECCRVLLGVTFIFSGTVKAIDPMGTAIKIGEYLASFGMEYGRWFEVLLSFNMIALEFMLGVCMLTAVYRKLATLGVLIFMSFMTPLTFYLAVFNPVPDCGCFGDAWIITNWQTFYKNLVLLAAAVFAWMYYKQLTSFYTYRSYWFVGLFSYLFCLGFCYWNYNHLPITDFRPYKVGANIPRLMEIPPDAPQDEYVFVYEKNGQTKEFKLEEAPAGDSTWTYVDARLVKQGFVPKVSSFALFNEHGENVADELFTRPGIVMLLVAHRTEEASDEHIDEINHAYDYAMEHKLAFYGVTGSSDGHIAEWVKHTGADYPFLTADEVLLKTIIRSNPGLVLLREGTILAKWHHNDIPGEEELNKVLSSYVEGDRREKQTEKERWLTVIAAFVLPLLLVWIYDYFRNRRYRGIKNTYN